MGAGQCAWESGVSSDHESTNVGTGERGVSLALGTALISYGLAADKSNLARLALAGVGGMLVYRGATGRCSVYNALGIDSRQGESMLGSSRVAHSVTINRDRFELYRFWRKLDNIPQLIDDVVSVQVIDDRRSRWTMKSPVGEFSWEAEITSEREGEEIAWSTVPGSEIDNSGRVTFNEQPGRGTRVELEVRLSPPGGKIGTALSRVFTKSPREQIADALHRFKQLIEAGEIASVKGQSRARGESRQSGQSLSESRP